MGQLQAAARVDESPSDHLATAEWLKADLEAVEQLLSASASSEVEMLRDAARHILEAGGKRLRPQLSLLSSHGVGYIGPRAVRLATVMELVHTATLVHDDIVDESDSRRGRATANFFWGNSASVLMGDYLVIRAFSLIAEDGDARLLRLMCDTISRMCEGEVLQICCRGDTELSADTYFTIIECKTAALMSACCQSGGLLAGAAPEEEQALAEFGRELGMAFQIQDDVLDLVGNGERLGKPIGSDLREAKVTLPILYALQRATRVDRKAMEEVFVRTARITAADVAAVVAVIDRYDGFAAAQDRAREFVCAAKKALAPLRPSAERDALVYLADRVVERDR